MSGLGLREKAKTSKEIAIYLHDAMGFIAPCFVKKEEIPRRIAELENEKWVRLEDAEEELEIKDRSIKAYKKNEETYRSYCCDKDAKVSELEGKLAAIKQLYEKQLHFNYYGTQREFFIQLGKLLEKLAVVEGQEK